MHIFQEQRLNEAALLCRISLLPLAYSFLQRAGRNLKSKEGESYLHLEGCHLCRYLHSCCRVPARVAAVPAHGASQPMVVPCPLWGWPFLHAIVYLSRVSLALQSNLTDSTTEECLHNSNRAFGVWIQGKLQGRVPRKADFLHLRMPWKRFN